ncbi:LOW QUALITY PROTEIN: zona pellucida sperm-binding protein 3-like [Polymixia lowei]
MRGFKPLGQSNIPIQAEEPNFPTEFEVKQPVPADSVTVQCGENSVRVEAKKDLLGINQPILSSDLTLGDCLATGEDASAHVLVFEYELHGCGSQLTMSEDSFVYRFTLNYTPSLLGSSPIVRTRAVSINVECHYPRKHDVSSESLKPSWKPYVAEEVSEESLYFSLKVMTDDWKFERPSSQYFLGDMMKIEASVQQFHHVPLHLFVDSCVATLIPNTNTVPRYSFLDKHGCLMDGKLTDSSSRFIPRTQGDKLQFQLEVFRFQQDNHGVIYITCHLKATTAESVTNKACSFSNGWTEASGKHDLCSCCDTDCGPESRPAHLSTPGTKNLYPTPVQTCGRTNVTHLVLSTGDQWEHEVAVGPIGVKERPLR